MKFCSSLVNYAKSRMLQPESQRRMVLIIVSIALLLDNMLYMVIVPIIPDYLRTMDVLQRQEDLIANFSQIARLHNYTGNGKNQITWLVPEAEDVKIGALFAFKAIVQLFFNPLSGYVIDRIGYDIPMVIGLSVIFISTSIFAFGRSFGVLLTARGLQGVGSAFADTAGLAMIADRYIEENERTMAMGIALAFISFGSLFAPPFGGVLYQYCGKEFPFIVLAFLALFDGFMVLFIMKPVRLVRMELQAEGALPKPVPIHRLLRDPYILICAGSLVAANVSLAFLEPTIATWMQDTMQATNSQAGLIWLPSFLPHVLGVYTTVKLAEKHPQYQWLMAATGLLLEGISCLFIPMCSNFVALMFPICILCYGIALVDTAILPCLGYLIDTRFVSVYGSVYAIADISYCIAYAIGPIVAGNLMSIMNFTGLNICICITTCAYAPLLYILRKSRVPDEERNKKMGIIDEGENEDEPEIVDAIKDLKSQDSMSRKTRLKRQETARFEPAGCRRATSMSNEFAIRAKQLSMECPGYEQGETAHITQAKPVYAADGYRGIVLTSPNTNISDGVEEITHEMSRSVGEFVRRISLKDLEEYPEWDLSKPLPRLPVPELRTTLTRYLGLVAPIVDEVAFVKTRRLVHEFIRSGGEGAELQAELKAYAETQSNWAFSWWLDDMYLKNPLPLPVNSNPGMVFPRHQFISARQQLRFAAQLISGILDYKTILDTRSLPIDRVTHNKKGQPLCMEQYYRLFTSYRYPGLDKDKQVTRDLSEVAQNAHCIVACHDQFYKLDLLSHEYRLGEQEIYNQLRRIVRKAYANKEKVPRIGALTALPRPRWGQVYKHLCKDLLNAQNLDEIAKSMFILCLDISPVPVIDSLDETELTEENGDECVSEYCKEAQCRKDEYLAEQMLHGQGSKYNGANRWYDKTMQFIISRDGNCGLNYEHSVAEGVAVIRLIEYILKYMEEVKRWRFVRHTSICSLPEPIMLRWNVDENTQAAINEALVEIDRLTENLDLFVLRFNKFGRDFPKTVNMSPDSFIQLALQLTHYKIHGCLVATYESASTRRFQQGRVDNIRAASVPALKWCRAMVDGKDSTTLDDRIRLLRAAMDWQTEVMLETILGYGVDIHLLGLQQIALIHGKQMPAIFEDSAYKSANQFRLSTSQVPTKMDAFMCYGAVVPDGYGAAYNPHPDSIVTVISSWKSNPRTNAVRFAEQLEQSFMEMHDLVLSNPELAKQKSLEPNQWTIPEEISGVAEN